MDNITIVFCEGMHDINFISKLLYINGYEDYKIKLNNFLKPLGEQYLNILKDEKDLQSRTIGFNPLYKVPSVALYKGNEELVLFHNMLGDGSKKQRTALLNMYKQLQDSGDDFSQFNLNFKFLYFFDADNNSVQFRVDSLNQELSLSSNLEHAKIQNIDSYKWGCYIFHRDKDDGGYLEDILLDLMKPTNEDIFDKAQEFILTNKFEDLLRTCEYNVQHGTYKDKQKFKDKKSIISIAGQLQFSGMNNSVIISNSDYINKSDILANEHCQAISALFHG